jgi:hypothetical protein
MGWCWWGQMPFQRLRSYSKNGQQSELSAEMKIPLRHKNSFRCIVVVNCQHNVKIFSPYQEGERKKSVIFCSDLFMTLA